jgi:hypothetical protein
MTSISANYPVISQTPKFGAKKYIISTIEMTVAEPMDEKTKNDIQDQISATLTVFFPKRSKSSDELKLTIKSVLLAIIERESHWFKYQISSYGATGIAQLMPGTAVGIAWDILNKDTPTFALARESLAPALRKELQWLSSFRGEGKPALPHKSFQEAFFKDNRKLSNNVKAYAVFLDFVRSIEAPDKIAFSDVQRILMNNYHLSVFLLVVHFLDLKSRTSDPVAAYNAGENGNFMNEETQSFVQTVKSSAAEIRRTLKVRGAFDRQILFPN